MGGVTTMSATLCVTTYEAIFLMPLCRGGEIHKLILVQPPGGLGFNPISGLGTNLGGGLFAKPIPYCFQQPRPLEKHIPWHAPTFYTAATSAAAAVACAVVVVDVHRQIAATGI